MQFLFFFVEDQDLLSTSFRAIKKPWRFCPFVCFFSGEAVKQSGRQSTIIINLFIVFLVVVADSVMCYHNCGA